jgi:hypothetical protein
VFRITLLALVIALAVPAFAQSITVPPEELKAYEAVRDAADADAALAAAKAFAEKHPKSAALAQVEIDVYNKLVESPRGAERLPRIAAFKQLFPASDRGLDLEMGMMAHYFETGNHAEIFRVGEAVLAKRPDDVEAHYLLLRAAVDALKQNNTSYVAKGKAHGTRALELFAQAGVPPRFSSDAEWQAFRTERLPLTHQSMGLIGLATGDAALASEYLPKAIEGSPSDPLNYFFLANLRYLEYTAIAQRYNSMGDKSGPDAKKALDDANAKVDDAIDLLAKTVVLADANPQHAALATQARSMLEENWKQRHGGKLDGLDAKIKSAGAKP